MLWGDKERIAIEHSAGEQARLMPWGVWEEKKEASRCWESDPRSLSWADHWVMITSSFSGNNNCQLFTFPSLAPSKSEDCYLLKLWLTHTVKIGSSAFIILTLMTRIPTVKANSRTPLANKGLSQVAVGSFFFCCVVNKFWAACQTVWKSSCEKVKFDMHYLNHT